MEGLLEPILVHPVDAEPLYELISGERRWRAALRLGWQFIPARIISVISEGEAAAKAVISNVQPQSLDPMDEAEAFAQLHRADPAYWTFDRIAQACGKSLSYIQQSLKLLHLPKVIQERICQGLLSRSQALEITRLPEERLQAEAAGQLADRRTARTARFLAESLLYRQAASSFRE
uniref:ParB-like partition protein n=1 Tax=uncultured bacterium CSLF42 TaxID=1091574 RepID=G4WVX7_9BACT|nr:ParB-like partition protein [uncultured bacterium CSLF42]